jgi:hypothetical protein
MSLGPSADRKGRGEIPPLRAYEVVEAVEEISTDISAKNWGISSSDPLFRGHGGGARGVSTSRCS